LGEGGTRCRTTRGAPQAAKSPQGGGEAGTDAACGQKDQKEEGTEEAYAKEKVLIMRTAICAQATWLRVSATYSGSASQITRLRPLRLAA
jgi:hypothetical protein